MYWSLLPAEQVKLERYNSTVAIICPCGADVAVSPVEFTVCRRCGRVYRVRLLVDVAGPPAAAANAEGEE